MAPSPRKRAQPTTTSGFNQTWDDKDAAFLDPSALPLAKIPRGWERKQEVKKIGQGREKKIWRRFNLRSRAANTPNDDQEEEHDSRSRAVKKLQRLSPKTMERTTIMPGAKKSAFKATRWDRRKSVLPRKKTPRVEDSLVDVDQADELEKDDQPASEDERESSAEVEAHDPQALDTITHSLPEVNGRRSTFTFTMDTPATEDLVEQPDSSRQEEVELSFDQSFSEEATLSKFFRSPLKASLASSIMMPDQITYPELPASDDQPLEYEDNAELATSEPTCEENATETDVNVREDSVKMESGQIEIENIETSTVIVEDAQNTLEAPAISTDIAYPDISIPAIEPSPSLPVSQGDNDGNGDIEMSDSSSDLGDDERADSNCEDEVNADSITSTEADEEFTEASLQLDIQREYEETLKASECTPMEIQEQQEEALPETQSVPIEVEEQLVEAPEQPAEIEEQPTEIQESPSKTQPEFQEQLDAKSEESMNQEPALQDDSAPVQTEMADIQASEDISALQSPDQLVAITSLSPQKETIQTQKDDITDGLTLSFTPVNARSAEPTPRRLHSPPPPPRPESGPDDVTMTIAIDDDTAILKDFLSRAAASKAERAAIITHRRESIQNRRDSDVVRHALASPRKVLEEKDPNSPSKYDNDATLDLSQTLTLSIPSEGLESPTLDAKGIDEEQSVRGSRRSSRTKKSRLPAPASVAQAQASKIAIRRADGNEVVVLKKNDVQELASLTRSNTRKNKQGAFGVAVRLLKLAVDAPSLPPIDDSTREIVIGKNVRWDEQLAYYQENPEAMAEAESLATPDELSMPDPSSSRPKTKTSKSSTPKIRRVRGLGTANGTPGKGLLAPAALLPEAVSENQAISQLPPPPPPPPSSQQLPRPKATKMKKVPVASTSIDSAVSSNIADSKLPTLDVTPVGLQPAAAPQRKSRLAAPKKVMLPQPIASSIPLSEGKENAQQQRTGLSDATPKKGIPVPKVLAQPSAATVGMESGLPRRRGRKML